MKKLDVLYSSDNKYVDIMMASAVSLMENSNIDQIVLHIITYNFSGEDYRKIERIVERFANASVFFYKLEDYDMDRYHLPTWHGLQTGNARLFFQDILKGNLSRIDTLLYLDGDTIVKGDLNEIEKYAGNTISACTDNIRPSTAKSKYGLDTYYNSGVLLINVNRWVEEHLQDKLVEEAYHPSIDLYLPDQNLLNAALRDDISELPINYNLMPLEYLFSERERNKYYKEHLRLRTAAEVSEAIMNPKIFHSCCLAGLKPWYKNDVNPFNDDFLRYVYEVNPDFTLTELNTFRRILNDHPLLLRKLLLLRNILPDEFNVVVTKLSMFFQRDHKGKAK